MAKLSLHCILCTLFLMILASRPLHVLADDLPPGISDAPLHLDADHDNDDDDRPPSAAANANQGGRYFFGLLDHRSMYGKQFFPDALIGPEFDSEKQIELDYLHSEKKHGVRADEIDGGFQWTVGDQWTIAGEFGWDSQHQQNLRGGAEGEADDQSESGGSQTGWENVNLAVYHPIFQYVSPGKMVDYTAVVRFDVGIPTRGSSDSQDVILTPYIGQLLRLGDHVAIQGWTGTQITIAPNGGDTFIYGANFAYIFYHPQLPIPGTTRFIPMVELDGQTPMNNRSSESLNGVAGFEMDFNNVGKVQPELELGYLFPLDQGARDQLGWGIVAQVILDFGD